MVRTRLLERNTPLLTNHSIFAQTSGFEAIADGNGISIAVTGMLIVFFALSFISLFIRLLPVVLAVLEPILPRLESHDQPPSAAESLDSDKERIVAAIGFVLHQEMKKAASKQ